MSTMVIRGNDEDSYSRRGRRAYDEDEDDDRAKQREQRRARRAGRDDDEDEEDTRSSRRTARRRDEDEEEEEDDRPRRGRRGRDAEEEEEAAPTRSRVQVKTSVSSGTSSRSTRPGATLGAMTESKRRRVQQAIIDSMFKYAESKYGKKKKKKPGKGRSAKEEYDLYMKSVKARAKTADDKLQGLLKQLTDIEDKVRKAEDEKDKQSRLLRDAEREKDNADSEGRDPVPPSTWVSPPLPNQGGNKKAKANFASLVMSASSASWDEKFAAMKAKKAGEEQPEWTKKVPATKKRDPLLSLAKKRPDKAKKDHHQEPAWGSVGLKKSERTVKKEVHHVDKAKPEWSKKALSKSEEKHADHENEENDSRRQRRSRRRGGDDSD